MDPLRLEAKMKELEDKVNMSVELASLSLEKIDELRNKVKFAMEQEITSESDEEQIDRRKPVHRDTILSILSHRSNMKTKLYLLDDEKNDKPRRSISVPRHPSPRK